ncbi:MAG: glycosyltransferase family 2 protein, partial [Candidatus Binatia bacterium]
FDEQLPACEDYDLWLRLTSTVPVPLIETPLVIKRGGHADQLSRQFWGMDRFRVTALCKLLDSGGLSPAQRQITLQILQKKCTILARGAQKRGQRGQYYLNLAEAYAGSELASIASPSTTTGKEATWVNGSKRQ